MPANWNVSWSGATDQGKVRSQNQDNYYGDPRGRFLIVADGMGGHSGGEIASQITVDAVIGVLNEVDWDDLPSAEELVDQCVKAATDGLKEWVKTHPDQSDLGTTLLLWIRSHGRVILASLGDSRIYLLRENRLFQITFDQTIESELRRRGATRDQAFKSPGSAYLSRCILASRICEPDIISIDSRDSDVWMLCSDGLTREVDNEVIHEMMMRLFQRPPRDTVHALVERALQNGGRDNVTVVVAKLNSTTQINVENL